MQTLPKEKIMKRKMLQMLALIVAGTALVSSGLAQNGSKTVTAADKYLISAKAGGVSLTEGTVNIVRANGKNGGFLLKGDQVEIGDTVTTAADGRAEILLNPGSYMRLGGNSTIKFKSTSLDDLRIILTSGSAMFEVFATDKFRANVITPKEHVAMIESGVYRIDLGPGGIGEVSVIGGKAVVGIKNLTLVPHGKMAAFGNGMVTISKISKDKKDDFAKWSKSRAKDLARMTASLKNSGIQNSLFSSYGRGWNMFGSFGLWINDPRRGYCFLPFGHGWYSPYGYDYGYWYSPRYVPPVYQPPTLPINPPQGDLSRRKPVDDGEDRVPPFVAIDRQLKTSDLGRRIGMDDNDPFTRNDPGRYNPPPSDSSRGASSPSPSAAAAPTKSELPPPREANPIDH